MARINECTKNRSKRKAASHYSQDVEMVLARKQCATIEAMKIVEVPEK